MVQVLLAAKNKEIIDRNNNYLQDPSTYYFIVCSTFSITGILVILGIYKHSVISTIMIYFFSIITIVYIPLEILCSHKLIVVVLYQHMLHLLHSHVKIYYCLFYLYLGIWHFQIPCRQIPLFHVLSSADVWPLSHIVQ